jgi:hypothetical protein
VAAQGEVKTTTRRTNKIAAADLDAAFERFWGVCPKRVAKEATRRAFAKVVKGGVDPEVPIAGMQRYAVERQGEPPRFTKNPTTWLDGGCWLDEPTGAPVIDEHGNVVAYEQQAPIRARGFESIAGERIRDHEPDESTGW